MCPTALGRKEKKLYNVHIVQWWHIVTYKECWKIQRHSFSWFISISTGVLLLLHPKLVVLVLVTTVLVTGTARTGTGATTARVGRLNAEARPEPIPRPAPRPLAANLAVIFSTRLGAGAASEVEERRVAARRQGAASCAGRHCEGRLVCACFLDARLGRVM